MKQTTSMILILALLVTVGSVSAVVETHGANAGAVTKNSTKTYSSAGSITGYAGNISEFNISVEQQTSFWAGFYGNVTHTLVLAGGSSNFYSWSGAVDSTGVVFFANSSAAINWGNIAATTAVQREEEDTALGITGQADSVNNTFTGTNAADVVVSDAVNITAGSSTAVDTLSNGGTDWETVLLRETGSATKIYAGVIQQDNENYEGSPADFQVMVPVSDGSSRQYWLYAALS